VQKLQFDDTFFENPKFPTVFVGTFEQLREHLYAVNQSIKEAVPEMAYTDDQIEEMLDFWRSESSKAQTSSKS
jgi:hypothetical protein